MYQETYSTNNITGDIRSFLGYPSDYPLYFIVNDLIFYFRKSRKDEELYKNESLEETLERHIKTIQEWTMNLFGTNIPEENIFKEVASGETIAGRPVMQHILKLIEGPRYKAIVSIDPQRLTRGDMEDQGRLIKLLQYSNTKVITPTQWYDLNNKFDNRFFKDKMRESESYLEYAKERMGSGRVRSVLDGTYPHSIAPYGYNRIKLSKRKGYTLEFNQEEYKTCKLLVQLLKYGIHIEYTIQENDSWQSIARLFGISKSKLISLNKNVEFKINNCIIIEEKEPGTSIISNYFNFLQIKPRKAKFWTPAMIRNILKSLACHGFVTWGHRATEKVLKNGKIEKTRPVNKNATTVRGIWEPIFTEEEKEVINTYFSNHKKTISFDKEIKNPLMGLMKCELCDSTMQRRPYYNNKKKTKRRIHEIDKEELQLFLRKRKNELHLSLNDIAHKTHISKCIIDHIFSADIKKFTIPKSKYWSRLLQALELESTPFDKAITEFEEQDCLQQDTIVCKNRQCKNVASELNLIEKKVIESLKIILCHYKDYVKNYSVKVKEDVIENETSLQIINNKITLAKEKINKICDLLENGTYTQELFNDRKIKIDKEISDLEKKKKQLSSNDSLKKLHDSKKAIPNIENVLSNYNDDLTAEQKNLLLSNIIQKITYKKEIGGKNNKDNFTLKLYLKI